MDVSILSITGLAATVSIASPAVTIDWVTVGNVGNAADYTTQTGAVDYEYRIAKYETTAGQYVEFLNAVAKTDPYKLYGTGMASQTSSAGITRMGISGNYSYSVISSNANKPITYVSWFDAARFCNWLHNGQGNGSTETGAYTLNGAMSGLNFTVNPGAKTWIPSADEWYKAAYFDPTKGGYGGYWRYPTRSDAPGGNTIGAPHSANYNDGDYVGYPGMALTDVGAYGKSSESYYGTNDQGGNVSEWSDDVSAQLRRVFGGSWYDPAIRMSTTSFYYAGETGEYGNRGFRVASVPEPSALSLAMVFSTALCARRKR
jgi:formylglycine-generating enzyme required for sulfatase activity